MEKLSIVLAIIGFTVLIFSFWGLLIIRKHIKRFNSNQRISQGLNDEKYFELKARQDYIIATSAIIFAVLSFIGFASLNDMKTDLKNQFAVEKKSMDSLYDAEKLKMDSLHIYANETNATFSGLRIEGKDLKDSMRSSLNLINTLKRKVAQIFDKEIIKQNLFIIDNLHTANFPIAKYKFEDFRYIGFETLKTISGQKLPIFSEPPSIIVFTTDGGDIQVTDITKEGFKIFPYMGKLQTLEESKNPALDATNLKFTVWISQKEMVNR